MDVAEQIAAGLKEFVDSVPALQQHDDVDDISSKDIVLDPRLGAMARSLAQHQAASDVWDKITDSGLQISALCKYVCCFFHYMLTHLGTCIPLETEPLVLLLYTHAQQLHCRWHCSTLGSCSYPTARYEMGDSLAEAAVMQQSSSLIRYTGCEFAQ